MSFIDGKRDFITYSMTILTAYYFEYAGEWLTIAETCSHKPIISNKVYLFYADKHNSCVIVFKITEL